MPAEDSLNRKQDSRTLNQKSRSRDESNRGYFNQREDSKPSNQEPTSRNEGNRNARRTSERPPAENAAPTSRNLNSRRSQRRPELNHRQQHPILNNLPRLPTFSLAGSASYAPNQNNVSYVAPGYHELNPNYNAPANKPLWGLAKPLPRVVRPGMRGKDGRDGQAGNAKRENNERTAVETEDQVGTEAIPQLDKIASQRQDDQRPEAPSLKSRPSNTLTRGQSKESNKIAQAGTPKAEIGDPMDHWASSTPPLERGTGEGETAIQAEARQMHNRPDFQEPGLPDAQQTLTETDSRDYAVPNGRDSYDDAFDGDKDDKLRWAADHDDLEEYEVEEAEHDFNRWSSTRRRYKEPLAEFLGTLVAMLIGICANLSVKTSSDTAGTFQSENWAWGLGITLGIYVAGGISGAHLNPAISLLLCLYRGFPFRKACIFILAQLIGAFLAGLIAFAVYRPAILHYSPTSSLNPSETGTAFYLNPTTWTGGGIGTGTGFLTEFVSTAILGVAILALGDDSNAPPGAGMHALIIGLIVTVLTMAFGYSDGCGLNPARDLGPRMAAAAVGYGKGVFEGDSYWWIWGVWGGEVSGVLFGGLLYDVAIFVGGESPINFPSRKWGRRLKRRIGGCRDRRLEEGRGKPYCA